MKYPRRKRIACIVTAIILLAALGAGYAFCGLMIDTETVEAQIRKKLTSISSSLTYVFQSTEQIESHYNLMLLKNARLSALPLRERVRLEGDEAIRAYNDGCVLRIDGDKIVMPPEMPFQSLDADAFRNKEGVPHQSGLFERNSNTDGRKYIFTYQRVLGNYYFLDYTLAEKRDEYMDAYLNTQNVLNDLENAFRGYILLYRPDNGRNDILYKSSAFDPYDALEDMGIDPNLAPREFATLMLDGEKYLYTLSEPAQSSSTSAFRAAFLMPYSALTFRQIPRLVVSVGASALIFITAITWMMAVYALIRRSVITEFERKKYGVKRVRQVTLFIGIAGMLAVMLTTTFVNALLMLHSATRNNQVLLDTLQVAMTQVEDDKALVKSQVDDAYISYAQRVAALLSADEALCNRETLQEICDVIGVDYLMVFDDEGREILSNAPYVNLTLGTHALSATYDFRRLLRGVPSIAHEAAVDEATGLERQLVGVCMKDDDLSDGYGALLLARVPDDESGITIDELMRSMTTEDNMCLMLDPDSGVIQHASNPDHVGENALTLGLPESALKDNYMDYMTFDGPRWYSCSNLHDGSLYHCATLAGAIYRTLGRDGLIFGALFLAAYALLAAVLLYGYTEKFIDEFGGQVVEDNESLIRLRELYRDSPRERLALALKEESILRKRKPPERQAWFAFGLTMGLLMVGMAAFVLPSANTVIDRSHPLYILSYVMSDRWKPGVNLFAIGKIILMLVSYYLLIMVLDLISSLMNRILEKRAETIFRLFCSTIKYIAALALLFSAFNCLGFDTNALLASVGFLSLAVSLGARDLVSDILSGISIAFSNEYQIGDFIEVNGFRGWVLEIGVRTTTMVNTDGHIKHMSNRDVKNVLNLSRRNCRYSIDITITYDQSLQQVEELLNAELPKIGESISEILTGPIYRGITAMGNGGMTLTIVAECKEQHYGRVRTRLNREIRLMLEKNGIKVK